MIEKRARGYANASHIREPKVHPVKSFSDPSYKGFVWVLLEIKVIKEGV
ncbi:hypothetical protein [Aliivibrio fischeri]|nr:hypothetical protein [Aliivibrio fischeri]